MTDTVKKGFTPFRDKAGGVYTGGTVTYKIDDGYSTTLAEGDPVALSGGYLVRADNGDDIVGVFEGCQYVDADGQTLERSIWVASTSTGDGNDPIAFVVPASKYSFIAQVDEAVVQSDVGKLFPVIIGTASTAFKRSAAVVDGTDTATAGDAMVKIVGVPDFPGSQNVAEVVFFNTADGV